MPKNSLIVGLVSWIACAAPSWAADAPDFNTQVAPVFKKYCVGCHNSTDKEGQLVLEKHAGVLAGGENGAIVVPGKSEESRLILVLTGRAEPAMPPKDNEKPTAPEVAALAAWINAGAKNSSTPQPEPTLSTPAIKPVAPVREAVTALAISPDGKSLAAARLKSLEFRSLADRELLRRRGDHRGRISALSFSKDGKLLVAASGEPGVFGEASLWPADGSQVQRVVRGHQDSLYAATISPDGLTLATGSYDQQIKLWNVADGRELRTLSGHNDAVFDLAFRPDGKILASASGDRTVKLWNVATGERLDTFGQPLKELYAVAFSPDGNRVAAGGVDNRIRVWQISAEGKENTNPLVYSRFAHEGPVVRLVYSADGKTLVSAGEDRTVKIWNADTVTERFELERQSDTPAALALAPDGKQLVVGRLDGSLAYYDTATGQVLPAPAPAKPELSSLSSRGVQSATTSRLVVYGKHLAEVTDVKTNHEKLIAKLVAVGDEADRVEIEVTPASELPRGRYELWLIGAAGESGRQPLFVDDLPQLAEVEPNDALQQAGSVGLGSGVWGVLDKKGDLDSFSFEARAGQKLVFEVAAAAIGSKANAVLTLFDANGRALADNNDFGATADPLMAFSVPADGRYTIQVGDLLRAGDGEHFYRLSLGELAVATSVYPLSVPKDRASEVEVIGFNIPPGLKAQLPAAASGDLPVPLDSKTLRVPRPLAVTVGQWPESLEAEPNDAPAQANAIEVPATIGGRLGARGDGADNDYFRFQSKAGQTWIVETDAARRGSPVDTVVEVLTAEGRPIERVLLQAVRDSNVTFRGIDGNTRDCRLTNWEEMQLNQLVYLNGEVVKLFRSPRGPDSGFLFYEGEGGKRQCYFDTTATVHAVEEPCFIVEPHAPGTRLVATGLPVFPVYYNNDDDGMRRLGSDSRLSFTAPADGGYLVRVRDARGAGGDRYAYRLTVRPPRPDFAVSLTGGNPTVGAGSGKRFTVVVDRTDGFDGAVQVEISGLPAGFRAATPIVIQPGQREADGVIFAASDAAEPSPEAVKKIVVQAKAELNGHEETKPVAGFGSIKLEQKTKLLVRLEPAELVIAPGTTIPATLKVERHGHDDLITFSVENLPHGVIVDNIGLNGVLLPKGETERQIFITADSWVPETSRPCFAIENQAGNQCSPPVVLHVRAAAPLAKAAK